jgi:hypothetical protein
MGSGLAISLEAAVWFSLMCGDVPSLIEPGGFAMSAPVSPADIARALRVVRVATGWSLTPARWAAMERATMAVTRALAVDDGPAFRAGISDITLLGPVRQATPSPTAEMPGELLNELAALIDALTELASMPEANSGSATEVAAAFVPVAIYLRDESSHERVERAVEDAARSLGLDITERDEPVVGSWFRRMRATLIGGMQSHAGQEVLAAAAHRADLELVLRPEAEVAALWMVNLAPLITSLENTQDAVVYLGIVLIVKNNGALSVNKLTTRQQLILNHSPHLLAAPGKILRALGLPEGEPTVTGIEPP